jgi:hypothetical protein
MTPARDAFPDAACSDWLAKIDAWSQRTGRDLGDLAEHEVPCAGCDEVLDMRNLSQVFEHEHRDLPKRPLPVGAPSPSSSVTTTPEKRAELRADLMKRNRGTTHWSGCEGEHRDCMLLALLDEVERLEEALSDKPPPADAAPARQGEPDASRAAPGAGG